MIRISDATENAASGRSRCDRQTDRSSARWSARVGEASRFASREPSKAGRFAY
jgi:hypothetical protein